MALPEVSIVVPFYNEEDSARQLISSLTALLEDMAVNWELLLVSDGSTDATELIISEASNRDERIKGIFLSRNFGHQAALCAGLDHASGRAVISMDADLQHPPEMIKEMVRLWKNGIPVVYTVRTEDSQVGLIKGLTSKIFYSMLRRLTSINVGVGSADFRLLDRRVVDALKECGEHHLFYRGLVRWIGFRQAALPYVARTRFGGKSKYTYAKMFSLAEDALLSFTDIPLTLAMVAGAFTLVFAIVYGVYIVFHIICGGQVQMGWTSLMFMLLLFGGTILFSLGIIGRYIGRIYDEVKRRPRYVVGRHLGVQTGAPNLK